MRKTPAAKAKKSPASMTATAGVALARMAQRLLRAVQAGDRGAARHRVKRLQALMPEASTAELQRWLVQSKCLKAGAVAALSSIVPRVPLVGAGAGALLGDLADRDSLISLQADLVLEVFALHDMELPAPAERMAILAIAATQLTQSTVGDTVVSGIEKASRNVLGGFLLRRALPIADIGSQTATAIASTYAIGQRSGAIARFKDAELHEWPELLRAVSGIDERQLVKFASAATRTAFEQVADSTRSWVERLGRIVPVPNDMRHAAESMWSALVDPPATADELEVDLTPIIKTPRTARAPAKKTGAGAAKKPRARAAGSRAGTASKKPGSTGTRARKKKTDG